MNANYCEDPIHSLKEMFVDKTMNPRIKAGQCPVRRAVFLKPHGIAEARFEILSDLTPPFNTGIFSYPEIYKCWVRFASDTVPGGTDYRSTTGIGIKLFDVEGRKMMEDEPDAVTADFTLQNHPVFFVDNAEEMCRFTYAGTILHDYNIYLKDHPETKKILNDMAKIYGSVLDITYWSGLPYQLGTTEYPKDLHYVKYSIVPEHDVTTDPASPDNSDYLHDELKQRLLEGEVRLGFYLQLRTDPEEMPLDKAMTEWSETLSPPVKVAVITLLKQDIDQQGQDLYGENLSFNPWRTIEEHTPVGSISEARKEVYRASAELRRYKNGVPAVEPIHPRTITAP